MSGSRAMVPWLTFLGCLAIPAIAEVGWLKQAASDLAASSSKSPAPADVASASEDAYCSADLKKVLRRVAGACGLLEAGARGCKPADARTVAALSGNDFNALFKPLAHRARIIQFDAEQTELDERATRSVEAAWSDQRGASFFFIVARASPDGDAELNLKLSERRAESVLGHLEQKFQDPDLKREVGLLWLGEEYAQLSSDFCGWARSREGDCTEKDINRSAFIAWIDCAI
jgi:outer membrane protein OmpA-like peptidoglycan-associated protein